ncbi:MAG: 5-(carboxyamino)imidazole ribonucleotide mutase [Candidatus Omnitrophica bacterium]|nr:5-(carboxyamino)imidazole ribonucleotide mutase [Candidatus Omnitrophota bacterium]MBD3269297.1 5-(carboxyamino)imidazole ribonucleotide mutase [Candidatus Omnitrophota bacterium]
MTDLAVVVGSKNDIGKIQAGIEILEKFNIQYELKVISAHRNPDKLRRFCKEIEKKNFKAVIACAGMAAALPGFVASYVDIPVIGVALEGGFPGGIDALLSIVGVPKGLGLASTGVGKSAFINAVIFFLEIMALKEKRYSSVLKEVKGTFK